MTENMNDEEVVKGCVLKFRCTEEYRADIKKEAIQKNLTVSEYIKQAVDEYMYKEIRKENMIYSKMQNIESEVHKCRNQQTVLFIKLAVLEKFLQPVMGEAISKKMGKTISEIESMSEIAQVLKTFKKLNSTIEEYTKHQFPDLRNVEEIFLADYILESSGN